MYVADIWAVGRFLSARHQAAGHVQHHSSVQDPGPASVCALPHGVGVLGMSVCVCVFSATDRFGWVCSICARVCGLCFLQHMKQIRLEGMDDLLEEFFAVVTEFRGQGHNLLDFENQSFDRNYVGFNVKVSDLETRLQAFINRAFARITSIQSSFELLERLQLVLQVSRRNVRVLSRVAGGGGGGGGAGRCACSCGG